MWWGKGYRRERSLEMDFETDDGHDLAQSFLRGEWLEQRCEVVSMGKILGRPPGFRNTNVMVFTQEEKNE